MNVPRKVRKDRSCQLLTGKISLAEWKHGLANMGLRVFLSSLCSD